MKHSGTQVWHFEPGDKTSHLSPTAHRPATVDVLQWLVAAEGVPSHIGVPSHMGVPIPMPLDSGCAPAAVQPPSTAHCTPPCKMAIGVAFVFLRARTNHSSVSCSRTGVRE